MNSKILKPIYGFFTKIVTINSLFNFSIDFELLKNVKLKEELLDVLTFADFSIKDLELVKSHKKEIRLVRVDSSTFKENNFEKETRDLILVHNHQGKDLKINFIAESSGTQKFIFMFYNLLKIKKDLVVLYDEIETSFNVELIKFIIKYFSKKDNNFQLLFSTHQPEILNYLRSDQINIIEKEDLVSKINNFYNIVKKNSKISKNYGEYYKEGIFWGIFLCL